VHRYALDHGAGVPVFRGCLQAAELKSAGGEDYSFIQISDSPIGVFQTRRTRTKGFGRRHSDEARREKSTRAGGAGFLIHTGDPFTHLSKPENALRWQDAASRNATEVHYVPANRRVGDNWQTYMDAMEKQPRAAGWYGFDHKAYTYWSGEVPRSQAAAGATWRGPMEWIEKYCKQIRQPPSWFRVYPSGLCYPDRGWGNIGQRRALAYLKKFGRFYCVDWTHPLR